MGRAGFRRFVSVVGAGVVVGMGVAFAAPPASDPPPEDGEVEEPSGSGQPGEVPPPPATMPPDGGAMRALPHPPAVYARTTVPSKDGMLLVPGGRFVMGTADPKAPPNERPPHVVSVAPFWIDRTEVTVGAYRACVDKRVCARPATTSGLCTYDLDDPDLPVSCVHWHDAETYCHFIGRRLPHETEWELAARGPFWVRYPWGNATTCTTAVTLLHDGTARSCSGKRPAKVGTHPQGASPFGVLDMSGNVEEWTADWYAELGGAAPRSGAARVLRGGGWLSGPSAARTTSRDWGSAMEAGPNVGFRCAKEAAP